MRSVAEESPLLRAVAQIVIAPPVVEGALYDV